MVKGSAGQQGIRKGDVVTRINEEPCDTSTPEDFVNYMRVLYESNHKMGYMDATGTLGGITLNQTGREMECLLLLMLFYLIVSLSISAVMNVYNKSVALKER